MNQYLLPTYSPSEALQLLNNHIFYNRIFDKYVPVIYGILNIKNNTFTYTNAGHEYGIHITKTDVKELSTGGLPLGMEQNIRFEEETIHIDDKDILLLFTDGLLDARNKDGIEFGHERLKNLAKSHIQSPYLQTSLVSELISKWSCYTDKKNQQKDDMTLIAIERNQLQFFKSE